MPTESVLPDYEQIDVTSVTPRTSVPYAKISFTERNSMHVLRAENGLLLIGPLGVNYYEDGPADRDGVYLRRWDVEPLREKTRKTRQSRLGNDPAETKG